MDATTFDNRYRGQLIAAGSVGLLLSLSTLAQPMFVSTFISRVEDRASVVWPLAMITVMFILQAVLTAAQSFLLGRASERITALLRWSATRDLLRSDVAEFRKLDRGDTHSRLVSDTQLASVALADGIVDMATSGFMVVGAVALMLYVDVGLAVAAFGCLSSAALLSALLASRVRAMATTNQADIGAFSSGVQRILGSILTIKSSRAEDREEQRIASLADRARRSGVRLTWLSSLFMPAATVGLQLALLVTIGWGMSKVVEGHMSLADLTAFVMYLFFLLSPLAMLFMSLGRIQRGRAALSRVKELKGIKQEADPVVVPCRLGEDDGIAFEDVRFGYDAKRPVLRDVSLRIPPRGVTAIVGLSGAGKTTLFQLLERFYHPDSGSIRVGEQDISSMPLGQLRGLIGYVEQDVMLFSGSLRENICYSNHDAAEADVAAAIRLAGLQPTVDKLPSGMDTILSEGGVGLSGGEKQRVAIARALLKKPRFILLDEATAHQDSETEAVLLDTLKNVSVETSVIVIAHRLSTISIADRIVVLDGGSVHSVGTHEELLEVDERYRTMILLQMESAPA
ncbi:hypothetical protein BO226_24420 (plasmid) [Rhodococcus sp. 2G]|nr:hypothetical protein BO226_24420 [Rhodococcus sp. 2G]